MDQLNGLREPAGDRAHHSEAQSGIAPPYRCPARTQLTMSGACTYLDVTLNIGAGSEAPPPLRVAVAMAPNAAARRLYVCTGHEHIGSPRGRLGLSATAAADWLALGGL